MFAKSGAEQNKFDADLNSALGARLTNVKSHSEDEMLREKRSTLSYGQQASETNRRNFKPISL